MPRLPENVNAQETGYDIGAGLQNVAQVVTKVHQDALNQARQTQMQEADNALTSLSTDLTHNPQTGAFTLQGKNAFGLTDKFLPQFDKNAETILDGVADPRVKAAVAARIQQHRAMLTEQLNTYEIHQHQQYGVDTSKAGIDVATKAYALNYNHPDVLAARREDALVAVGNLASQQGWSADKTAEVRQDVLQNMHSAAVSAMLADGKTDLAKTYLETIPRDELDPQSRRQLNDQMTSAWAKSSAAMIVDQYRQHGVQAGARALTSIDDRTDMTPDQKDAIRQNVEHGLSLWHQEQAQKFSGAIEALHQHIASGQVSQADVDTAWGLYRNGVMSPEQTGATVGALTKALTKGAADDAGIKMVDAAVRSKTPLDPADKDIKENVSAYLTKITDGITPLSPQYNTLAAEVAAKTGVIPATAIAVSRTALVSGTPQQAAAAADLIARLAEASPRGIQYAVDDKRTAAMADTINTIVKAGGDPMQAVEIARERDKESDGKQKALEQRWSQIKLSTGIQPSEAWLRGDLAKNPAFKPGFFKGVPDDINRSGRLDPQIVGEFENLTREYFDHTGGDLEQSRRLASRDIQQTWGVTQVNGKRELIKYPPELTTGLSAEEIRAHLADEINANPGATRLDPITGKRSIVPLDPKDVRLVETPETGRTRGQVWALGVPGPYGSRDLLRNPDGSPVPFVLPDPSKTLTKQRDAEAAAGMARARAEQKARMEREGFRDLPNDGEMYGLDH